MGLAPRRALGIAGFYFDLAWSVFAVPLMPACVPPGVRLQLGLDYLGWDLAKG